MAWRTALPCCCCGTAQVANAVFTVVSVLVIKDRTEGTGRFNVAAGALATTVGVGAALSATIGGRLIQRFGYRTSFTGLAMIGLLAFALLWRTVPETLSDDGPRANSETDTKSEKRTQSRLTAR